MTKLALCLVLQEVGSGAVDPGFGVGGGHPSQPIHHPGHPDHGLPSSPGHPANRPPGSGGGDHIGNQLPWSPNSPDNSLPVPPGVSPPPVPGGALKEKLIVLWHLPNTTEWHGKVIDPSVSAGTPLPETPQPK